MSEGGEILGDAIIGIIRAIAGVFGMITILMGVFCIVFILPYGMFGLTIAGIITGIIFGILVFYGLFLLFNDKFEEY